MSAIQENAINDSTVRRDSVTQRLVSMIDTKDP